MQTNNLIYSFPRGTGEEVQLSISEHNGKKYVDVRQWFKSKNENVFLPTKKGICFSLDQFDEFYRGVQRLKKAVDNVRVSEKETV